ncbi:GSCFA domain-containing protein [Shewanella woodyi]|uniref:GSCFA domain protein n=1 Tax=Shewanella woodyi (strain ATCC 51908 / MS32) TaxID=392500 RepID=B1KLF0_SHEWM|nr:GSCFA domain-containing protein [Shewanella woodyi]ACA85875.1 GSCFA domain protein [Shewanella woodyi ATCC 51908]
MQKTGFTPYSHQGDSSFWRTGVADIELGHEIFPKLHNIHLNQHTPRISSIGSCFAQHVGKWLNAGSYLFNQSKLESNQVSSFAFGNLYTPRGFLQWFDIEDRGSQLDINCATYCKDNRYYDLLRPNFNPAGFDSLADLVTARSEASAEMRATITTTDVLVFTLGLTEAWRDNEDVFYPSCPGIISGKFDDSIYQFHNFSYEELCADLKAISARLKSINPTIQIILTVSPVPLTATMTDKHILVANQGSKSLLRTVAGFMSDHYSEFSYFPSYELITVPNAGDFRFESNLRSVTPQAVNYVMQHFKTVIDKQSSPKTVHDETAQTTIEQPDTNEVVCEDELLEATKKLQESQQQTQKVNLTLFGDSHMGKLSRSLNQMDIPHCGGMVMNGSGFSQKKFAMCDAEYFVPLESAISRKLWSEILVNLNTHQQDKTLANSTIITNLGMQTHQNISRFSKWLEQTYPEGVDEITTKEFVDYFNDDLTDQLSILLKLHNQGHTVIVVSDPPFCQYFKESKSMTNLIYSYFYAVEYVWSQFGLTFFNAATTFDQEVTDPETYLSEIQYADGNHDWIHGNDKYYSWLANKLIPLIQQK